ncbi:MAG: biotin transporter BioY [Myxococcales bacterium]|nr:biotin transporter BioY [Myxococcales bacterium]
MTRRLPTETGLVLLGVGLIAAAARVDVPMVPVPMSLQTYAVLVVAGAYGARLGVVTLLAYVAAAAVHLPVLAGGGAGLQAVLGPTFGYLVGFVVAAGMVGTAHDRGWASSIASSIGLMVAAHAVILGLGAARLSWLPDYTPGSAYRDGVHPFLIGGVVKSVSATATLYAMSWVAHRRRA